MNIKQYITLSATLLLVACAKENAPKAEADSIGEVASFSINASWSPKASFEKVDYYTQEDEARADKIELNTRNEFVAADGAVDVRYDWNNPQNKLMTIELDPQHIKPHLYFWLFGHSEHRIQNLLGENENFLNSGSGDFTGTAFVSQNKGQENFSQEIIAKKIKPLRDWTFSNNKNQLKAALVIGGGVKTNHPDWLFYNRYDHYGNKVYGEPWRTNPSNKDWSTVRDNDDMTLYLRNNKSRTVRLNIPMMTDLKSVQMTKEYKGNKYHISLGTESNKVELKPRGSILAFQVQNNTGLDITIKRIEFSDPLPLWFQGKFGGNVWYQTINQERPISFTGTLTDGRNSGAEKIVPNFDLKYENGTGIGIPRKTSPFDGRFYLWFMPREGKTHDPIYARIIYSINPSSNGINGQTYITDTDMPSPLQVVNAPNGTDRTNGWHEGFIYRLIFKIELGGDPVIHNTRLRRLFIENFEEGKVVVTPNHGYTPTSL